MIEEPAPHANDVPAVQQLAAIALHARPELHSYTPLTCPRCGDGNLHPIGSGVHDDRGLRLLTADGFHWLKPLSPIGRGSALVSLYQCEGECVAVHIARFHKGETFAGWWAVEAWRVAAEFGTDALPLLWRD